MLLGAYLFIRYCSLNMKMKKLANSRKLTAESNGFSATSYNVVKFFWKAYDRFRVISRLR